MSETAGMAMAAGASPRPDDATPSYVSRYDGPPDSYPEVAREITMLLGQADIVNTKIRHVEEEFSNLREHLTPVVDQRPKPSPGDVAVLKEMRDVNTPQVGSPIAFDLRRVSQMLRDAEDSLVGLSNRIDRFNRDVTL